MAKRCGNGGYSALENSVGYFQTSCHQFDERAQKMTQHKTTVRLQFRSTTRSNKTLEEEVRSLDNLNIDIHQAPQAVRSGRYGISDDEVACVDTTIWEDEDIESSYGIKITKQQMVRGKTRTPSRSPSSTTAKKVQAVNESQLDSFSESYFQSNREICQLTAPSHVQKTTIPSTRPSPSFDNRKADFVGFKQQFSELRQKNIQRIGTIFKELENTFVEEVKEEEKKRAPPPEIKPTPPVVEEKPSIQPPVKPAEQVTISKPPETITTEIKPSIPISTQQPSPIKPVVAKPVSPPSTEQLVQHGPREKIAIPSDTRPKAYLKAKELMDKMDEITKSFEPLKANTDLKKRMAEARKAINRSFNQIDLTQSTNMRVKNDLYNTLTKYKESTDSYAKEFYNYVLFIFADGIISQAEAQSTELLKIFPYAKIASELMLIEEDVKFAVIGLIHKRCVFSIPMYISKGSMTPDQYKRAWGFKMEEGKFESEPEFMVRMKSIMYLYAAIIQTNIQSHKYGPEKGWEWLSSILNIKPTGHTAEMVDCFLEVAGYRLCQTYKSQFGKIINYMESQFVPSLSLTDPGSVARIKEKIRSFKEKRQIPPVAGSQDV